VTEPSETATKWSRADFLDRAQELKRRLEVWHIQGAEPVYAPKDVVLLMEAERQVFRDRVMLGEHNPNPNFQSWNIVGDTFIRRPKDRYAKFITTWEFREFVERLATDAGRSEEAKLVRLKIDRILDAPMHKRARIAGIGDHIVGREVDPSLLSEFEEAVRVFASKNDNERQSESNAREFEKLASDPVDKSLSQAASKPLEQTVGENTETEVLPSEQPRPPKSYGAGEDGLRRDAKIYALAEAGWKNEDIAKEIEKLSPIEKWECIGASHVPRRLEKYCLHTGSPVLNRGPGRPKSTP
jgi:hypothetical protein